VFGIGVAGIISMEEGDERPLISTQKNLAIATHIAESWLDMLARGMASAWKPFRRRGFANNDLGDNRVAEERPGLGPPALGFLPIDGRPTLRLWARLSTRSAIRSTRTQTWGKPLSFASTLRLSWLYTPPPRAGHWATD